MTTFDGNRFSFAPDSCYYTLVEVSISESMGIESHIMLYKIILFKYFYYWALLNMYKVSFIHSALSTVLFGMLSCKFNVINISIHMYNRNHSI